MERIRRLTLTLLLALLVPFLATSTPALGRTIKLSWQPNATRFWQIDGHAVTSLFHNGQCTMWAQERRPDIVRDGIEAIVAHELAAGEPENMGDWDARDWPANARLASIPTGQAPRARALVVFQPGVLGAGRSGHIAYVQRVFANGSFRISEMHAPHLWRVSHEILPAADGRLPGVTFIY